MNKFTMITTTKINIEVPFGQDDPGIPYEKKVTATLIWEDGKFTIIEMNFTTATGDSDLLNAFLTLMEKVQGVLNDPPVGCEPA